MEIQTGEPPKDGEGNQMSLPSRSGFDIRAPAV